MSDRDIVAELTAEHDDLLARTARAIVWAQTQPEGAEDPHMRWMLRQIEAMSDYVGALAGRIRALREKQS